MIHHSHNEHPLVRNVFSNRARSGKKYIQWIKFISQTILSECQLAGYDLAMSDVTVWCSFVWCKFGAAAEPLHVCLCCTGPSEERWSSVWGDRYPQPAAWFAHSEVFCNVSKIVLCGRRNTFATFSEDVLQFSWQAQHFGRVHRHFSSQAQHFRRVVLSVFCKSHWQGCVKWRQVANSVAGVAFCDMCWKLTEASHETSILRLQNLEVPTKTRRSFLVASPCLWGKLQNISFLHVEN